MDIASILNVDDEAVDWDFEDSEDECGQEVVDAEEDADEVSDSEVDVTTSAHRRTGNVYVDSLIRDSGLHIVREFFTREFRDSLLLRTNKMLKEKGKQEATVFELDAYIGLEIAMSFNLVTQIKELWSTKLFMGQADFGSTMSRNRFESIRARFQIHAPDTVPVERREQDPLWHSRRLVKQIQQKFAAIAVPVGAVSLDENTVRTKARSSARTFMPLKPDKYGVRFYAVVGWKSLYAYSVWDNGSGNRTRASPAERYVDVFPALRTPLFRAVERADSMIKRKDPSALWVAMCGHMTKTHPGT
ncbi:hypothetical protein PHMEG_00038571 [Phytophthora megakarya]|uniref:PiggyBac transposable element-derived protein domain-containing protein n=1 Tax=Phytophthora megakarya TaxID=4795 RepID=A0A225UGV3_9STRA|nr:hypothetical protein PHMEG_00038571 [Phytophthora megakarya]